MRDATHLTRLIASLVAVQCVIPSASQAQGIPSRPLKIVVTFGTGTGRYELSRTIAAKLAEPLGHDVVVVLAARVARHGPRRLASAVAHRDDDGAERPLVRQP